MKKSISSTNLKEAYAIYLELIWMNFFEVKRKLYSVEPLDINTATLHSILLIDHVFWYMFHYSNNLELCRFVTERSKLLYVEFLQMSRSHDVIRQSNSFPTIADAFNFSLRKSIGTLTVGNHHFSVKMEKISLIRENVRKLFSVLNSFYPYPDLLELSLKKRDIDKSSSLKVASFWSEIVVKHMFQNLVTLWTPSLHCYEISERIIEFIKKIDSFLSVIAFFDWWFQISVHDGGNMSSISLQMETLQASVDLNLSFLENMTVSSDDDLASFLKVWEATRSVYHVS